MQNDSSLATRTFGNRFFIVALTASVIAILAGVLAGRMETPLGQAERAHVAIRLAELRSAVLLMQATMVAADDWSDAERYVGSNPMDWLEVEESDQHYLGELTLEEVSDARGKWVFDPRRNVIAYRPLTDEWWVDNVAPAVPWLQFQVVALWSEDTPKRIKGLELAALNTQ